MLDKPQEYVWLELKFIITEVVKIQQREHKKQI
jgi:hypothetical protein